MFVHYPFRPNIFIPISNNDSNKSDEIFICCAKEASMEKNSEASKSLCFALKGVRYWYLKQCATQSEDLVLYDLLSPFLEPLFVESKVWCIPIMVTTRENTVNSFRDT